MQSYAAISFGDFRLVPSERLLTKEGVQVELGARAIDALICLVSRPNEVFSKKELVAWVWPDATVGEGSLRFQMAALRKALGDGKDGARYITTLAGRGYCFVAPTSASGFVDNKDPSGPNIFVNNLPVRLTPIIGRASDIENVAALLSVSRFLTIVGTGGVGKTTVAVAVAQSMQETASDAHLFIDLGMLNEANMIAASLTTALGITNVSTDYTAAVIEFLRDKQMLLVFDNCEHLVEEASSIVERLVLSCAHISVLATSREPLRSQGERVYRLAPLDTPQTNANLTAATALTYSAVQLFVERAAASGAQWSLVDSEAAILASICEKLDGLPLAIELTAARFESYGLQKTADLLNERLSMSWQGRRTLSPRQKTLEATLDWSYQLLSPNERLVLQRLAVFVGHFTFEAALEVIPDARLDRNSVLQAVDTLVSKSMIAARPVGAMMRYRLLETTRAFLLEIESQDRELSARHAVYFQQWLLQIGAEWPEKTDRTDRLFYLAHLHNIRAALTWCFGPDGDPKLRVGLAAAAAPVFFAMSLLAECQSWAQRAILLIDQQVRGTWVEMRLQSALSLSQVWTARSSETALKEIMRSLSIAEEMGDRENQVHMLAILLVFKVRIGEFRAASLHADKLATLVSDTSQTRSTALSNLVSGFAAHFAGRLADAHRSLATVIRPPNAARPLEESRSAGLPFRDDAMVSPTIAMSSWVSESTMARTLWMQGRPAVALQHVRKVVTGAGEAGQPATQLLALMYAITVMIWNGDLDQAEEQSVQLALQSERHSLQAHLAVGKCFRGQIAILRGDFAIGIGALQDGLGKLAELRYAALTSAFRLSFAQGLAAVDRRSEAVAHLDETIRSVEEKGDVYLLPELLRAKAAFLVELSDPGGAEMETLLLRSISISQEQGARAWELRASIDLAVIWSRSNRGRDAQRLLDTICKGFTDGLETPDLAAARLLLATLR